MVESTQVRIGALASGLGAGLAAILVARLPMAVVVVDRPCPATEVAARHGVPTELVLRIADREAFTRQIVAALTRHQVDLVVMAGFMTILGQPIFEAFPDRVLNVHPSLLPAFRGAHAVDDVLAAGADVTGCTVHIATEVVDSGPILAQESVPVEHDDTIELLTKRIQSVEHRIYPEVIRQFIRQWLTTTTEQFNTVDIIDKRGQSHGGYEC
jgi:phosphoribosylglycinamide formyltransferase-1